MKDCRKVYRRICENLDKGLDSPQCREIKKHLEKCPDCLAYLDSLKKTVLLYRVMPSPAVSKAMRTRLFKVVGTETRSGRTARRRITP